MRGRELGGEGTVHPLAVLRGVEPARQRSRTFGLYRRGGHVEGSVMRGLKVLVVGLGIAVVAAFLTLVVVIFNRSGRPAEGMARPEGPRPPLHASWGRAILEQPAGTRIQSVTASGTLIVLQLYTQATGQDERLVVLDPATGAVSGTFQLGPR
jgi:hypothetical protein